MRLLVCGGRDYDDHDWIFYSLDEIHKDTPITCIIEGNAKGADVLAASWAWVNNVPVEAYPADWDKHGKSAGPIRNAEMIEKGKPDCIYAFPGGRGTANMVKQGKEANIRVIENWGRP